MLEFPLTPSFALGGGVPITPSSYTLWVPKTLAYIDPYTPGPSHPVGMNSLDFTGFILNFSSGRLGIETWSIPFSLIPFTFNIQNVLASIQSSIQGPSVDPSVGLGGTSTPFTAYRFVGGHIPPSTPFVGG